MHAQALEDLIAGGDLDDRRDVATGTHRHSQNRQLFAKNGVVLVIHAKAAEKLLRRFGFKKEGQPKQAFMKGGIARDTILLGLTKDRYKGLKHVKKEK